MEYLFFILFGLVISILLIYGFKANSNSSTKPSSGDSSKSENEASSIEEQFNLTEEQQGELCQLAHKTLEEYVRGNVLKILETDDPALNQLSGVFITLRKAGALRGCIGQLWAENPIYQAVQENTIAAATRDPRFSPVMVEELGDISVKISVLSPLHKINKINEIIVGTHGLMIEYVGRRGVLLPQVPLERGWDRTTFLENLCLKAGLPPNAWKDNPTIYSFTSFEFGDE